MKTRQKKHSTASKTAKSDVSAQFFNLIISALERFKRKSNIGFDAELNGLQLDPIESLEVVNGEKIWLKYWPKQSFETMSKSQYFDF